MNQTKTFHGLRFERPMRRVPRRILLVLGAIVITGLLGWLLPPGMFVGLMLLAVGLLTWLASYGWRPAVATLITLLHRLEEA